MTHMAAVGNIAKPKLLELAQRSGGTNAARRTVRQVCIAEAGGFVDCPTIVEEMVSTTLIRPGPRAEVDRYGNSPVSVLIRGWRTQALA